MEIEWGSAPAIITAAVVVGGVILAVIKLRTALDFAPKSAIEKLDGRVMAVELRLASMPSHEDMRQLSGRIGALEMNVATLAADTRSIAAGVQRVEHMTGLMQQHMLGGHK